MATLFRIIDGYNLLHAAGLAQAQYAQGDLARQRSKLLMLIANGLSTDERQRCTVVFDAVDAPRGLDNQFQHEGIAVLFANPGQEADDVIEELISRHSAARQLEVVSSDHRLQKAARIRRAMALGSEAFLTLLSRRKISDKRNPNAEKTSSSELTPTKSSSSDVTFWMREFGPIDVKDLARDDDFPNGAVSTDPRTRELEELQRMLDNEVDLDDWLNDDRRE